MQPVKPFLCILKEHRAPVVSAGFSSDSRSLVTPFSLLSGYIVFVNFKLLCRWLRLPVHGVGLLECGILYVVKELIPLFVILMLCGVCHTLRVVPTLLHPVLVIVM